MFNDLKDRFKEYLLYNVFKTYWVVYTPQRHVGGMYPQGDSYLTPDDGWSFHKEEAKRYWNRQYTVNRWTRSKKVTIK